MKSCLKLISTGVGLAIILLALTLGVQVVAGSFSSSTSDSVIERSGVSGGDPLVGTADTSGWQVIHIGLGGPTGLEDVGRTSTTISLVWEKGDGVEKTLIRYRTDQYPTSVTDGTQAYFDTGSSTTVQGLLPGQIYYFRAWPWTEAGGYGTPPDDDTAYTLPGDPSGLDAATISSSRIDLAWTKGTGGDTTVIMRKELSYPTSVTDGIQVYSGTDTTTSDTGLGAGIEYLYRAWAYDTDSGYYSESHTQDKATTWDVPAVQTNEATNVGLVSAKLNATVVDDGGTLSYVRFQYGETTGYGTNTEWQGPFGDGVKVPQGIDGLSTSQTYHFRAQIYNAVNGISSPASGSDKEFVTYDSVGDPNNLLATPTSAQTMLLTWVKGNGSTHTMIRYKTGEFPTGVTDGYQAYFGTETTTEVADLLGSTTYYFRAWGYSPPDYWSTGYAETTATTPADVEPWTGIMPDDWFEAPDDSKLVDVPGYDLVKWSAEKIGMPTAVMFSFYGLIFCAALGIVVVIFTRSTLWTTVVTVVAMSVLAAQDILSVWTIFAFVVIAGLYSYLYGEGTVRA